MRGLMRAAVVVGAVGAAAIASVPAYAGQPSGNPVIHVRAGQSIQWAVDHAGPGTTIKIGPGTFRESITIRTDDITIVGSGEHQTTIAPPTTLPNNLCTQASGGSGFCVFAKNINPMTMQISGLTENVRISDVAVSGFPGMGIMGLGTSGLAVHDVRAIGNGAYGMVAFNSTHAHFTDNTASGSGEAGFYIGDSPDADAVVADNVALGNTFGIFVRHAHEASLTQNSTRGNCEGILVLDDGQPGGVGDVTIWNNRVVANNRFCPPSTEEHQPAFQGGGIALVGAQHTKVADNRVFANRGAQINSGGILLISAKPITNGLDEAFVTITDNTAFGNKPADLAWDGKGTHIVFTDNECRISSPAGLCN